MPRYGGRQKEFDKYIGVRIKNDLHDLLTNKSTQEGKTVGDIIRTILYLYFTN